MGAKGACGNPRGSDGAMTALSSMAILWECQRGELNHDWLKNRVCPAIARMRSILSGAVDDHGYTEQFISTVLIQWADMLNRIDALIVAFEEALSPRSLLTHGPLTNMAPTDRTWFGDMVHRLWISRYPVRKWMTDASIALAATRRVFADITSDVQLEGRGGITLADVDSLYASCIALAQCIEKFPHRILVMEGL